MLDYYLKENEIIEIKNDLYANSPRDKENFATFITTMEFEFSPDETEFENFDDILKYYNVKNTGNIEYDLEKLRNNANKRGIFLLPVYFKDSDWLHYSIHKFEKNPDINVDIGLAGIIYVDKKKIYQKYNTTRLTPKIKKEVIKEFEKECREYTLYVNYECYSFSILDCVNYEIFDGYGGFFGDVHESGLYDLLELRHAEYFGRFENFDEFKKEYEQKEITDGFEKIRSDECWNGAELGFKQYDYCTSKFNKFDSIPTTDQIVERYNDFRHDVISELEENYNCYKSGETDLLFFLKVASELCKEYETTVSDVNNIYNNLK